VKTKLLIFGITGDLSIRKLLPAVHRILATGEYDDLEIIGVSRRGVDMRELLERSVGSAAQPDRFSLFSMNLAQSEDYHRLKAFLNLKDGEQLLAYLSVPPQAATQIVDFMGQAGLNTPNVKILFEKPFGVDLTSAKDVIARTARHYDESQLYRIDHYLAKEMAQNVAALRGGNALFSHLWNRDAIEKIDVVALEKIDIEGRGQFYEQTGALRDIVQGHLMQLLALTLMDIPPEFDWDELPAFRLAALSALKPADPSRAIRAQYEGYQDEAHNPGSVTETFVSVELFSTDGKWKDVPFRLTTGKALDKKTTEVRVHFKKAHDAQSNCLTFRIQPDEGVEIELFTKKPGYERDFERRKLAFTYPEAAALPDAYEQVLVDAIRSRKSLFTTSDEVLASWRVLQPLLDRWEMSGEAPKAYPKGSSTHTICSVE